MKAFVIHGPNLNLLGTRELSVYGDNTLEEVNAIIEAEAKELGFELTFWQTAREGEIIELLHSGIDAGVDGVLLNPAAYSHTSRAIADAIRAVPFPGDRGASQQHPCTRALEEHVGDRAGSAGHSRRLRSALLCRRARCPEGNSRPVNYESRVKRLQSELESSDVEALLVTNLTNVRYLTGFAGSNGQVLVTPDDARFMTDGRYRARAMDLVRAADVSVYSNRLTDVLKPLVEEAGITRLAVEGKSMTLADRDDLAKRLEGVDLVTSKGPIENLRRIKEPEEVDALRAAVALGDDAFTHILDRIRPGRTESEVALELEVYIRTNGAEAISFEPIVGSGPLSAHIHHTPSERRFEKGDFVLLDFGARVEGYCGDLSRTVVLGMPSEAQRRQYDTVLKTNSNALEAMKPDAECRAIDAVARRAVKEAGYDDFGHGLGHGVGLEIHESPRLSRISDDILMPGMVVTNEPGLYLEATGGVRIEDCVLITETGAEVLTSAPKDTLTVV